jgi:hypothetical protein
LVGPSAGFSTGGRRLRVAFLTFQRSPANSARRAYSETDRCLTVGKPTIDGGQNAGSKIKRKNF